ncbi:gliding motility protein RemB [Mucilaginibacter sp. FT3.2]|uniref:gliding motility protein RemB n=1 Tax=Mucilaginibacter sp. FT3.2 TaxID=2723090 RepID=UPI0017AE9746|nr:gliding motility protein RemB [Mucilaginibacter sp. FT3.2]MBB6234538.1 hypothetical protein [Mucilaginibacter sp. FT3.2]
MRKIYSSGRSIFFLAIISLNFAFITTASAQAEYQPYSYQFYQKLNPNLYSITTREHTAIKPFFSPDSIIKFHYDSLMGYQPKNLQHNQAYRKLFNEHLIDIKGEDATFYADLLPDFSIGRDFSGKLNTHTTSLGLQFGGTIGDKFQYYVSGYASRAVLPDYLSTYVNQVGIIPGQAYAKTYGNNDYDWSYITALVSYTPNKFLNIAAGRDKTFIGDGYRSLLLSDYASPYPFLKLTGTLGNVRYMVMWTYMNDPASTSQYGINRKKFGVFHYLDYNVNNRLSFGFFDNVIGFFTDDNGVKRPIDFNYINPIIFMKPVNNSSNDPDKSLLGFTGKYKISNGITAYGQFALNEFHSKDFFSSNGAVDNKYGWQLGIRGTNLFKINNLTFLIETNNVKPYTYSARSTIENYSENGEPLAHPWGANFRELVGLLNYTYKRFDFSGEIDLGRYGLNEDGLNYGKDIFKLYTFPAKPYGNYTGQGLTTNMIYLEEKVAFVVNPKYNLRVELGGIYRTEKNSQFTDRTNMITLGLRSSFRSLYTDLSSYKTH